MTDTILVLNAGSSSIKFSLFPGHERATRHDLICEGEFEGIGGQVHFMARGGNGASLEDRRFGEGVSHEEALTELLQWLDQHYPEHQLTAAGHRVVHGGTAYSAPVRISAEVIAELRRLIPLAPLHQPHHLSAIAAISKLHPTLPQIACFDTSFHHTQPDVATAFALPQNLTSSGVRRYGFHGLSYEYIAGALPSVVGASVAGGRVVVAHLGNGASMCAMHKSKSVATTMGFTALDGLPMGQRCGNLDPGVILYLLDQKGMSSAEISDLLYKRSGLLGVSGISNDMRVLLESEDPHAKQAIDLFVYRIVRELGSLATALGGLDALVFTAGIGEHAAEVRAKVLRDAAWLGFDLDESANQSGGPRLTRESSSRLSAWVIPTDEDLMIAHHTSRLLK